MRWNKVRPLVVFMATIIVVSDCDGQDDNNWIAEALASIKEYDERYPDILKGRRESVWDSPHPRNSFHKIQSINFSVSGSCRSKWWIDHDTGYESVFCVNSIYRFHLSRRLGSENRWMLKEMDYVPRENPNWFRDPELHSQKDTYVEELNYESPFTIFQAEMTHILKLPSLKTTNVYKEESGNVIVNCKYNDFGEDIDAAFEFLPEDWRLKSARLMMFHLETGTKKELVQTYSYTDSSVPKSMDQTITLLNEARIDDETVLPAGMVLSTFHADFYEDDVKQRRPSDFRLSFFGLPEPEGVRWGWPPAVWISIVGLLLLGIVAWKRARRSRTA